MHRFTIALAGLACLVAPPLGAVEDLRLMGWIERVQFADGGLVLEAKLDTGADHSSLHAENLETYEENGEEWVRFEMEDEEEGQTATIERPVERWVRMVGGETRRPVIILGYCVGDVFREIDVNLTDRSGLSTPMLVGRSFLKGRILVNSAAKYTVEPTCDEVMDR